MARARWISAAWLLLAHAQMARADGRMEPLPKELQGVGITEKLAARVPYDLEFVNDKGEKVALGRYFQGDKPTLLTLNYSNCPMLCSIQLKGLIDGLKTMGWRAGHEYQLVTVSLDPEETAERAHDAKQRYIGDLGDPEAAAGWHFLVGPNVRALADTVGFAYRYSEERHEYLHAPAVMVLSAAGEVSRYLYGITYEGQTLRLSLIEAAQGKHVSAIDQLILYCFHYDAEAGKYAPAARNIMRLAGALTVVLLGFLLGSFFVRDVRQKRRSEHKTPIDGTV